MYPYYSKQNNSDLNIRSGATTPRGDKNSKPTKSDKEK